MSKCSMIVEERGPGLKTIVAYIVVTHGPNALRYCERFVRTYQQFPAGVDHDLLVVCNGGEPRQEIKALFLPLNHSFLFRQNGSGYDIEAYQQVAGMNNSDFQVCLGESVYFHRAGWLAQMIDAREQLGPGIYGFFSSFMVRAHLNTTAFGCDPKYISMYPPVTSHLARYEFEHGKSALWKRVFAAGGRAFLVTADGIYEPNEWRMSTGILWREDQSACLIFCNHTERFDSADPVTKFTWQRNADRITPNTFA